VVTNLRAVAIDSTVPRYRPKVTLAEAQLDQAGMQTRANWQRNYAFGRGTTCNITVRGWRDANGALWTINRLIPVMSPFCELEQDLLIAGVKFHVSNEHGRVTDLRLGPVEGFTPDPGQVKLHTKRGKKTASGGNQWEGAGP
jgi:prophage tail gpP-like protein